MQMIMPMRRRRPVSRQMMPMFGSPFMGGVGPKMPSMATDISTTENGLDLTMELPGFAKDDVELELKDGYLVVSATMEKGEGCGCQEQSAEQLKAEAEPNGVPEQSEQSREGGCGCEGQKSEGQQEQKTSWVRRERFFGSCQRSFYVGEDIDEDGITAKFENGLLKVSVPRKAELPEPEQKKLIEIQ